MAKLAEQAYRFERNDNTTILLSEPYWSQAQSGLMPAKCCSAISRTWSAVSSRPIIAHPRSRNRSRCCRSRRRAAQSPAERLLQFQHPRVLLRSVLPGQYCRKIKAVRLTIPCVAGPLANIGATLTLTAAICVSSRRWMRPAWFRSSSIIASSLRPAPRRTIPAFSNSTSATSATCRSRAGAISSWKVELPSGFRQFDYQTISDVIVHISYTAQQDDSLRLKVETKNGAIAAALKSTPLVRLFSLRQEFPGVLNRLLHSPLNTSLAMSITPIISRTSPQRRGPGHHRRLAVENSGIETDREFHGIDRRQQHIGFCRRSENGGLWSADASAAFASGLFATTRSSLPMQAAHIRAPPAGTGAPQAATAAAIDDTSLLDVMLYVDTS